MNNKLKYSLIVIMILSLLANIFLFFCLGITEMEWEEGYIASNIQWCELSNDYVDTINDLSYNVAYYSGDSSNLIELENLNCWDMYE